MSVKKKTLIGTIDCTPTWKSLVPWLITTIQSGSPISYQMAMEGLEGMAEAADKYVELQKDRADLFNKVVVE